MSVKESKEVRMMPKKTETTPSVKDRTIPMLKREFPSNWKSYVQNVANETLWEIKNKLSSFRKGKALKKNKKKGMKK